MPIIKRKWNAQEADNWTKEDWIVIVLSPLAYFAITLGTALSMLLMWWGFLILAGAIVLTILIHWIIDPKLRVISESYEKKQKAYIRELEKKIRWEEHNE